MTFLTNKVCKRQSGTSRTTDQRMATARINMQHGFMKSIIKNQVDRDNYDKEVKARKETEAPTKYRPHKDKTKKPEKQVYIPPCLKKETKQFLFLLEFEDRNGEIHSLEVFKDDTADSVAHQLGSSCSLKAAYVSALAIRIQQEMDKRL